MRVSAIANYNYKTACKKQVKENPDVVSENVDFKGGKGAAIGAGVGMGCMMAASALSGPFFPLTMSVLAVGATSGAIAGHNIEDGLEEERRNRDKD